MWVGVGGRFDCLGEIVKEDLRTEEVGGAVRELL